VPGLGLGPQFCLLVPADLRILGCAQPQKAHGQLAWRRRRRPHHMGVAHSCAFRQRYGVRVRGSPALLAGPARIDGLLGPRPRPVRLARWRCGGGVTGRARNRSGRGWLTPLPDEAPQLLPPVDADLGVDVAEVVLDRLAADE